MPSFSLKLLFFDSHIGQRVTAVSTCFVFLFSSPGQPAKEEKLEESAEKSPEETKSSAEGEGEEEQKKDQGEEAEEEVAAGEAHTSIFQSPLRLVRKTKMKLVVCHVTLLDGTDFICEVEVRLNTHLTVSI